MSKNQCDGCLNGWPTSVQRGWHMKPDGWPMACEAGKYSPEMDAKFADPDWQARAAKAERELEEQAMLKGAAVECCRQAEQDRDAIRRDAERMRGALEEANGHVLAFEAQSMRFAGWNEQVEAKLAIAVGALEKAIRLRADYPTSQDTALLLIEDTARRALGAIKGETT